MTETGMKLEGNWLAQVWTLFIKMLNELVVLLTDARHEMLRKWKENKELKKKLEAAERAKKKPFRVVHISPDVYPFQNSFTQSLKVFNKVLI